METTQINLKDKNIQFKGEKQKFRSVVSPHYQLVHHKNGATTCSQNGKKTWWNYIVINGITEPVLKSVIITVLLQ